VQVEAINLILPSASRRFPSTFAISDLQMAVFQVGLPLQTCSSMSSEATIAHLFPPVDEVLSYEVSTFAGMSTKKDKSFGYIGEKGIGQCSFFASFLLSFFPSLHFFGSSMFARRYIGALCLWRRARWRAQDR
jgi:hypothetical protein